MFVIHCPTCQNRQLVGTRSITSFRNTDDGPVLTFRCPKGHEAYWPEPAPVQAPIEAATVARPAPQTEPIAIRSAA